MGRVAAAVKETAEPSLQRRGLGPVSIGSSSLPSPIQILHELIELRIIS